MGIQDRDYWRERYRKLLDEQPEPEPEPEPQECRPPPPAWKPPPWVTVRRTPQQTQRSQAWARLVLVAVRMILAGAVVITLARGCIEGRWSLVEAGPRPS